MEETSTFNTLVGLLCWAGICLIPLAGIVGGVLFFRKHKQNKAAGTTAVVASQPAVPSNGGAPAPAANTFFVSEPTGTAATAPVDDPFSPPSTGPSVASAAANAASADPFTPPVTAASTVAAAAPVGNSVVDLTPSEIVWLRGEAFSEPAGVLNSEKVLYNDTRVKGPALANTVLLAAILAVLQSGDAQLKPGKRKGLLKESDTLYLVPTGRVSNWPSGSYEAALLKTAESTLAKNNNNIPVLVFHVMQDEHNLPWMQVFEPLKIGLAQRGILEAAKGALGLSIKFSMTPATVARVAQVNVEPVRQTLSQFAAAQPALSELLKKEIKEGIGRRQESSD